MFYVIRHSRFDRAKDIISTHWARDPRYPVDAIALYLQPRSLPETPMDSPGGLPDYPPIIFTKAQALALAKSLISLAESLHYSDSLDMVDVSPELD